MRAPAGCIMVHDPETGKSAYFDYLKPDPRIITPGMLAQGMGSICRFKGMTTRPITLTEHSMRVARFAAELAVEGEKEAALLWGLLHDAHEVLTPWGDCPSPWKTPKMKAVEKSLDPVIWEGLKRWTGSARRGVPEFAEAIPPIVLEVVRQADMAALYYEAMLWQPHASSWAPDFAGAVEGFETRLLPLVWPAPGEDWLSELRAAALATAWRMHL